jgi:hypothetical protein
MQPVVVVAVMHVSGELDAEACTDLDPADLISGS